MKESCMQQSKLGKEEDPPSFLTRDSSLPYISNVSYSMKFASLQFHKEWTNFTT